MNELNKLVCLGDSISTNYKLKVRSNTFSDLLGRRLGLDVCNYSTPGATAGSLLSLVKDNTEARNAIKNAKIILISCGSNHVLGRSIVIMGQAAGVDVSSWRLLPKTIDALKSNPATAIKMVKALNDAKDGAFMRELIDAFAADMPSLIDEIKDLNNDAIIVVMTVYMLTDISNSLVYKVITGPQTELVGEINDWIKNALPEKEVLVYDFANEIKHYKGKEELSNIKDNDIHLSDQGHIFAYRQLYDFLCTEYPEFICDEDNDVIQKRKWNSTFECDKDKFVNESNNSRIVREIIQGVVNREIDYDENKQLIEMGIDLSETTDIARKLEIQCFEGKEVVELPFYNTQNLIRPSYFVSYLDGSIKENVTLHKELLPLYSSVEEKNEADKNDSEAMKVIKGKIREYLQEDLVVLNKDTSYFNDLHMSYFDWSRCLVGIEFKLHVQLDSIRIPSPETSTIGQTEECILQLLK